MTRIEAIRQGLAALGDPKNSDPRLRVAFWRNAPRNLYDLLDLYDAVMEVFMQDAMLNPDTKIWSVHVDELEGVLTVLRRLDAEVEEPGR